jgi:hypothetical protein
VNAPAPKPGSYSPVGDLAELCALAAYRLINSGGGALHTRAVLLRLRDGLDVGLEDSRDQAEWREAIERWLGGGMPGTPTGRVLADQRGTEMIATAQRQVLELNELLGASETRYADAHANASAVIAQQAMKNTALVAENARLRAELDAHGVDVSVDIIPGDRAMLERVLAATSDWQPEEGEVVRAAADGYQVTWRGGAWVPE